MNSTGNPPPTSDGESSDDGSRWQPATPYGDQSNLPQSEPVQRSDDPPAPQPGAYPPATSYPPAFQPYGQYGNTGYGEQPAQQPEATQPLPNYYYPPAPVTAGSSSLVAADGDPLSSRPVERRRGRLLLITALLAALVGGGIGGGIVAAVDDNSSHSVNTGLQITNDSGAPAAQVDGTIGAAAAKIRPSVVTIDVTGSQEAGTGSGVIIRPDGYILTNDHVVAIGNGAGTLQVTLSDGRTSSAKIVGRDTPDDLAVIKLDSLSGLPAATFAKSSSLSVGQAVVAVGAPLGLSDTVTSGIVSNLARPVRAGDNDQAVFEAVQTDAAINPGNSGGPLVDLNGSVVGINAAIASDNSGGGLQIPGQPAQQAGNIGIGFAIPSDEASRIASELIATGKATHAVLGVEVGGSSTSATTTPGVALHSVSAGGVAERAGLKTGDIVTAIDGQRVTTADSLIAAVRNNAPGQQVKVSYLRGGKAGSVTVTLGSSNS